MDAVLHDEYWADGFAQNNVGLFILDYPVEGATILEEPAQWPFGHVDRLYYAQYSYSDSHSFETLNATDCTMYQESVMGSSLMAEHALCARHVDQMTASFSWGTFFDEYGRPLGFSLWTVPGYTGDPSDPPFIIERLTSVWDWIQATAVMYW